MNRKEFIKAAVSSGYCTKTVAEKYADTKSCLYDFSDKDFVKAYEMNESEYSYCGRYVWDQNQKCYRSTHRRVCWVDDSEE